MSLPYFTFGDDYKMMKQIGFDVVMLAAVLFGVLAASMSISEEIEGRTAVTLMSKPVNRRQFLIGKFLGILMACLVMSLILGWNLTYALRAMREFDPINNNPDPTDPVGQPVDKVVDPMTFQAQRTVVPFFEKLVPSVPGKALARGCGLWFSDAAGAYAWRGSWLRPGDDPGGHRVRTGDTIAVRGQPRAVPVGLLPRPPGAGGRGRHGVHSGGTVGVGLVGFLGKLFDVLLPALEFFNMGPAIIREAPLDLWQFAGYVGTVFGYSLIYTAIALLVGLLLFEDRDLA